MRSKVAILKREKARIASFKVALNEDCFMYDTIVNIRELSDHAYGTDFCFRLEGLGLGSVVLTEALRGMRWSFLTRGS